MNPNPDYYRMSHAEIAKIFGVSRGTIQRIERSAIEKIRDALEKRGIKVEDFL